MSSNPTKSQAINAETTKNSKQCSDWLGGPQNGSEIPGNGGNVQAVDTQTGTQAKGMGSDGYTKHRFNETPSEAYGSGSSSGFLPENAKNPKEGSDWLGGPQNGSEIPGNGGNGRSPRTETKPPANRPVGLELETSLERSSPTTPSTAFD